jgi:5'-nucleotidase
MKNVIISNPKNLEKTKQNIKKSGPDSLHILSDFDRTLTRFYLNGERVYSLISTLAKGDYINPEYSQKAQALFDKYHAIEIDPTLSFKEKKPKMKEWWLNHFQLLIDYGLTKEHIRTVARSGRIKLRENFNDFIKLLKAKDIPLVILSSSGLGKDGIKMFLEEENQIADNIYIISNSYTWSRQGKATGVKEPIIHTMNKEAVMAKDFPFFKKIKERRNVVLLGDSLTDIDMITGFPYDNLIKIGFLNERKEEQIDMYRESYDIILSDDPSLEYINKLIREIT